MIDVNIENLESFISKASKLIENYENVIMAIDKEYDIIMENFQSKKMQVFYKEFQEEKSQKKLLIATLQEYIKLLQAIYNRYKELGKKISVDLDSKEVIIEKQESIINNFNKIVNVSNSLNDIKTKQIVQLEIDKMKNGKKDFLKNKQEVEKIYDKVENIENDIHSMINSIEEGKEI